MNFAKFPRTSFITEHLWWPLLCNFTKRRILPTIFSGEVFENEWLWIAASEQSEKAAFDVIQFLITEISFGILS